MTTSSNKKEKKWSAPLVDDRGRHMGLPGENETARIYGKSPRGDVDEAGKKG